MQQKDVLFEFISEHYAHARDHEHLRAQITSILCAASFVLIGFALGKDAGGFSMILAGILAATLGMLNLRLNRLHENRFKAHVAAASYALSEIERSLQPDTILPSLSSCRAKFDDVKKGSLSSTWAAVPKVVIAAGILLVVSGVVRLLFS